MGLFSFLFKRSSYVAEGHVGVQDRETVRRSWEKIQQLRQLGKPSNLREAVLEADKSVDYILKIMFPSLNTMGERLKEVKPKFVGNYQFYDDLWFAHKVRNEMVHNINFELPSVEASSVLEKFRTALVYLGVL